MKYKNKKTQVDMYLFDSVLEAKRYKQLTLLERAGEIKNLKLQVPFLLQESFRKNGKTYRKIEYIADFVYEEKGQTIVEDAKGMKTETFKIKQKLFEYKYPDLTLKLITKEEIYSIVTTNIAVFATKPKRGKSIIKIGNTKLGGKDIKIEVSTKFNWLQKRLWKYLLNIDIEDIKEDE